jgi:hypothetical protein
LIFISESYHIFPKYVHIYKNKDKEKIKNRINIPKSHNHTNCERKSTVASCIYLPHQKKNKDWDTCERIKKHENTVLEDESSHCCAAFSRRVVYSARSRSILSES